MSQGCPRGIRVCVGLVLAVVVAGCRSDGGAGGGGTSDEPETTQLDCERLDYPCTWAKVAPAVLAQSAELTRQLRGRMQDGASVAELAAELEDRAGVESVMFDEVALRFRLRGGRGVWIIDSSRLPDGMRGAASRLPQGKTDPVGETPPNEKPRKWALLLAPFEWEDGLGWKPCVIPPGSSTPASCSATVKVTASQFKSLAASLPGVSAEYDETDLINAIFADVRDYRCEGSSGCPCTGGSCIERVRNTWTDGCDPKDPGCRVTNEVTIEAFKDWKRFDVIHLATHGTELCDAGKKNCSTGIATGQLLTYGQLEALATNQGTLLPADSWWNEPGIEFVDVEPSPGCSKLTPGTAAYRGAFCHVDGKCPGPGCEILYRVYLGLDFFRTHYTAADLEDKLFFLNACVSMRHKSGLPLFLSAYGRSAVIGWSSYVETSLAAAAASEFYLHWLGGVTALEAFEKISRDKRFAALRPGFVGRRGLVRGENNNVGGPTRLETRGAMEKRGREIVFLLDPETDEELEDRGWVQTIGAPGDGEDDEIRIDFEVIGVDEDDDIADYELHLRVGGQALSESWKPDEQVDVGVWRRTGTVDLGFDLHDGQVEDIEVWTELPGGGISRWLYEDVRLGGPYWRMSFTGGDEGGRYWGSRAETRLAEDGWDSNYISLDTGKLDGSGVPVFIGVNLPSTFAAAPGTYPLSHPGAGDQFFELMFRAYTNEMAGYISGDGVTVDYPYDDAGTLGPVFRYPPPATLTITRVTDDIIEGRIEGQVFKDVFTPSPGGGHTRRLVLGSASIQFAVERVKNANTVPGREDQ